MQHNHVMMAGLWQALSQFYLLLTTTNTPTNTELETRSRARAIDSQRNLSFGNLSSGCCKAKVLRYLPVFQDRKVPAHVQSGELVNQVGNYGY